MSQAGDSEINDLKSFVSAALPFFTPLVRGRRVGTFLRDYAVAESRCQYLNNFVCINNFVRMPLALVPRLAWPPTHVTVDNKKQCSFFLLKAS